MYRIFESTVSSDIPLAGLPGTDGEGGYLSVKRGDAEPAYRDISWQHTWCEPGGTAVLHCAVVEGAEAGPRHLLRFPELAEFHVADTEVTCFPEPGCSDETLSHLLVDQVLPRLWAHLGHSVLHGSAVVYPSGGVGVFLGESGMGKSTLASALADRGCTLLSDDCISLVAGHSGIRVVPSYCGLRLYEDAIAGMALSHNVSGPVSHCSSKKRLKIDSPATDDELWLRRLYILRDSSEGDAVAEVPLVGAELLSELIKASFLLDVRNRALATAQMRALGRVATAAPMAAHLSYPRDFQLLPSVAAYLLA